MARWRITSLSARTATGRYLDECAEAEETLELTFNAEEAITSVEVECWRLLRDDERTSAAAPDVELVETGISATEIVANYVLVTMARFVRGEVYRVVLVLTGQDGKVWPRTWIVGCVA